MKLRSVDGLFLDQQARANLDFAADAERIDALVANGLLRMRPNHLPVIVLGTMAYGLNRPAECVETEQVESPAASQIGNIVDSARRPGGDREE